MMDRKRVRTEAEWQALASELQVVKRKLQSKSEALLIITKDLDASQKEKDQYKLMAERLRIKCQAFKRQFTDFPITKDQASLLQMLKDAKNQKIAHQKQNEVLQQKLNEALGDVKLLRERFARQRVGDEGVGPRHFPAHEREELVKQLEEAKQLAEQYRQELGIANDQMTEVMGEKEEMVKKAERLNNELNFMLNGDKKRIIDIDALCMENKYLQERVQQCQEEKNTLHAQLGKLKALLNSRKAQSTDIKPGKIRNSGLVISPKQVKEILSNRQGLPNSAETVSDLQSIAAALLETVNDKNLALHHLRNTNKILGKRVAELEIKLKTLEVAGLKSLSGQIPPTSSPQLGVKLTGPSPQMTEDFLNNLGSRLTKLSDSCGQKFQRYNPGSLTPDSSSSISDTTDRLDDIKLRQYTSSIASDENYSTCDISGANSDNDIIQHTLREDSISSSQDDVTGCHSDSFIHGDIHLKLNDTVNSMDEADHSQSTCDVIKTAEACHNVGNGESPTVESLNGALAKDDYDVTYQINSDVLKDVNATTANNSCDIEEILNQNQAINSNHTTITASSLPSNDLAQSPKDESPITASALSFDNLQQNFDNPSNVKFVLGENVLTK